MNLNKNEMNYELKRTTIATYINVILDVHQQISIEVSVSFSIPFSHN